MEQKVGQLENNTLEKRSVEEMRMERWMWHKTKKDGIRNERFKEHLGVASIGDKLR